MGLDEQEEKIKELWKEKKIKELWTVMHPRARKKVMLILIFVALATMYFIIKFCPSCTFIRL